MRGNQPDAGHVRGAHSARATRRRRIENFQSRARQLTPPAVGRIMPEEGLLSQIKRVVVGKPIPSHLAHHERLSRVTGLAVLSSDALSSVAYATDFILATLLVAGVSAFSDAIPISLVISALLAIVAFSYRQTIHAYPTGGGAYIVAKENIGSTAGLVAAASLLVDYTLTVAVSISAGVLAITSAFPNLDQHRVVLCLIFLAILTIGNLRGI